MSETSRAKPMHPNTRETMTKMTMIERAKENPGLRFYPDTDLIDDGPLRDVDGIMEWLYEASLTVASTGEPDVVIGAVVVYRPCSFGESIGIYDGAEVETLGERWNEEGWDEAWPSAADPKIQRAVSAHVKALWAIHGFFIRDSTANITAGDLAAWKEARR